MNGDLQARFERALSLFDRGRVDASIEALDGCLETDPGNAHVRLNLGHAHGAAGHADRAVALYRGLLDEPDPALVYAACWSLADLKGYRFTDREIALMRQHGDRADGHPQRYLLMFALGRALEQRGDHVGAFAAWREANEQVAAERPYPADAWRQLARSMETVGRIPSNSRVPGRPTPIFVVGMPRSGSTLVEQILSAHSRVQAAGEVPFLENLARSLDHQGGFAAALSRLEPDHCRRGAEAYLGQVRPLLDGDPDYAVDKWPDNFWYLGLARALFPDAPVVNVWRDPLDNALAVYKQHFSHGNAHASRLDWTADYWECYLDVMARWDALLPGAVLHLSYARLVTDPGNAIRDLLAHCGLDFEPQVLDFHRRERPVLTPSGQQVRQPIYTSAVGSAGPYREFMGDLLPRFETLARRSEKL